MQVWGLHVVVPQEQPYRAPDSGRMAAPVNLLELMNLKLGGGSSLSISLVMIMGGCWAWSWVMNWWFLYLSRQLSFLLRASDWSCVFLRRRLLLPCSTVSSSHKSDCASLSERFVDWREETLSELMPLPMLPLIEDVESEDLESLFSRDSLLCILSMGIIPFGDTI